MPDEVTIKVPDQSFIRGDDGFSPIVETEEIEGGHRITITDAYGDHPIDVMDGQIGPQGARGEPGNYTKPATGIPKTDLASDVRGSLESANNAMLVTRGTLIPDGSDLDDYTTYGCYYIQSASNFDTITSGRNPLPFPRGNFRLIVMQGGYSTYRIQFVISSPQYANPSPVMFSRTWNGSAWSEWTEHVKKTEFTKKPNSNLLDNWYFVGGGSQGGAGKFPINQRGQAIYTAASEYCIDRWQLNAYPPTFSLNEKGITIAKEQGDSSGFIQQTIDCPYEMLAGKTVTYSILFYDDEGKVTLATGTGDFPATMPTAVTDIVNVSSQMPSSSSHNKVFFDTSNNANLLRARIAQYRGTVTVIAVKLELGDTQTLAHNEGTEQAPVWVLNEIPDYGAELAKCRRYYQRFTVKGSLIGYSIANVMAYNGYQVNLTMRLGMRVRSNNSVSVTYSDLSHIVIAPQTIADGVPVIGISSIGMTDSGDVTLVLSTASDALTAGSAYNAAIKRGTDGYIAFSTDL